MRTTGARTTVGPALAAACLVLAACSSGGDTTTGDAGPGAGAGSTGAAAPAPDATAALRERCLSAIPDDAEFEALGLGGATGGEVEAARIGPATSDTVAVLLPQTSGLCGWGRWAAAAADRGVTSLLVNPCGYGESTCPADADADPLNEVAPALALAREEIGASRVVVLGTSMGGSLTVMAVAAGADVDAWADVSGPAAWEGVDLVDLAGELTAPGLVVMAPSEGRAAMRSARQLAREAGVRFVAGRTGHGWELLVDPVSGEVTRLGEDLVELALGRPAG